MPDLPLNHPEQFAATLGVMLYPGMGASDQRKARAFTAQYLARPIENAVKAGHNVPRETLLRVVVDGGEPLEDIQRRWNWGLAIGEVFMTVFALSFSHPRLASWNNAIEIYVKAAARAKRAGSHTALKETKRHYQTVAHLWAAWVIREGEFKPKPEIGYDGFADFQSFLTEAEILRDWGQNWHAPRAKSKPFLPADVWRVPEDWRPPDRQPGWPQTGWIPWILIPDDLTADLKTAGRPRKTA